MNVTEELSTEHKDILRVLDVLEDACRTIEGGSAPDAELVDEILGFLRDYADSRHHGKEEQVLFPALEAAGMSREGGPVGVMLHEHDLGRGMIARMVESGSALRAGDSGAGRLFYGAAREYAVLLRQHIDKEDGILFPMAERILRPDAKAEVMRRFADCNAEHAAARSRYARLLSGGA